MWLFESEWVNGHSGVRGECHTHQSAQVSWHYYKPIKWLSTYLPTHSHTHTHVHWDPQAAFHTNWASFHRTQWSVLVWLYSQALVAKEIAAERGWESWCVVVALKVRTCTGTGRIIIAHWHLCSVCLLSFWTSVLTCAVSALRNRKWTSWKAWILPVLKTSNKGFKMLSLFDLLAIKA